MRVIGDKNQISEDVFDFMISYLPFLQKSIRSELAKLFPISIIGLHLVRVLHILLNSFLLSLERYSLYQAVMPAKSYKSHHKNIRATLKQN